MRPNKKLREKYNTDYYDKSEFASKSRLLQSIWRVEKGYNFEKYGNFLVLDTAEKTGANFLTKNIFKIVKAEVENKHIDGKVIKEPRIWNNLLSSQPLAFNLFGELKENLELATKCFQCIYPNRDIKNIISIDFEYSPGRNDLKYTGDRSAFDVFIVYINKSEKKCFFSIEVKYSENLDDVPSKHRDSYETISEKSKIFNLSYIPKLKEKPIQQIWRDHLLTLSLFITNRDYYLGDFIYLYPIDNKECESAISLYQSTFNDKVENYFKPLSIEKLVDTIKTINSADWIIEFEDRYLNFEKINTLEN